MYMLVRRPRSLTELADSQAVSLATMSKSVSVLAERGWVERRKDPKDRRKLFLELTDQGRKVLEGVRARTDRRLDDRLALMDEKQCQELRRGLELLSGMFSHQSDMEI
jgi:DNA-binding MarR family transcriptional regulator